MSAVSCVQGGFKIYHIALGSSNVLEFIKHRFSKSQDQRDYLQVGANLTSAIGLGAFPSGCTCLSSKLLPKNNC